MPQVNDPSANLLIELLKVPPFGSVRGTPISFIDNVEFEFIFAITSFAVISVTTNFVGDVNLAFTVSLAASTWASVKINSFPSLTVISVSRPASAVSSIEVIFLAMFAAVSEIATFAKLVEPAAFKITSAAPAVLDASAAATPVMVRSKLPLSNLSASGADLRSAAERVRTGFVGLMGSVATLIAIKAFALPRVWRETRFAETPPTLSETANESVAFATGGLIVAASLALMLVIAREYLVVIFCSIITAGEGLSLPSNEPEIAARSNVNLGAVVSVKAMLLIFPAKAIAINTSRFSKLFVKVVEASLMLNGARAAISSGLIADL